MPMRLPLHGDAAWVGAAVRVLAGVFLGAAALLPVLRAAGLVDWPWAVAMAPLAAVGAFAFGAGVWRRLAPAVVEPWRRMLRVGGVVLTPAPARLERLSEDTGPHAILAKHPELLAALCLGFRTRRRASRVLGRPVSDGWGIYEAATAGAPECFDELAELAVLHTHAYAVRGQREDGAIASESRTLRKAMSAFRNCAVKAKAGTTNVSCTFEHVVVMFGAKVPSRDEKLRAVVPRLRSLLEWKYPRLAEARSEAESPTAEIERLKRELVRERNEITRARRDAERQRRKLEDARAALADAAAERKARKASTRATRQWARTEARAEQEEALAELRAALEEERAALERQAARFEAERERLAAAYEALSADHDALEAALFQQDADEESQVPDVLLPGVRILLVGGHEGQLPTLRAFLAERGVQLLHHDGPTAADRVGGMDLVVLWVRWVSHATAAAVKRECGAREVPIAYWKRVSPESLLAVVAGTLAAR